MGASQSLPGALQPLRLGTLGSALIIGLVSAVGHKVLALQLVALWALRGAVP